MPSIIESTNPLALETALIPVIAAITPTHPSRRQYGWTPTENNRQVAESSECPRLFFVEWVAGDLVQGGLTGNGDTETEIFLDVVTDYRGFDVDERGTVLAQDFNDLYDSLENAINVVPGLTDVDKDGEPAVDTDEDAARFRFPFILRYLRNRLE